MSASGQRGIRPCRGGQSGLALGTLVCGLCFLAGFVLTCLVIRRSLPFPDVPVVRPKLDWLAAHGDDFDAIFIGSSRVEHQIIPAIFDHTAESLHCPVRSFNAGVSAMVPPEDAYMLDQILQRPHRRLRWVFIEVMPLSGQFDSMLAGTERMEYWHDVPRMRPLTKRTVLELQRAWRERGTHAETWRGYCGTVMGDWRHHLGSFLARGVNYGQGVALIAQRWHGPGKPSRHEHGGPAGDGWVIPAGTHQMRGEALAVYEREYAAMRETPRSHVEDELSEETLLSMVESLRGHGIEAILFLPPTLANAQFYPTRALASVPFFDLSDMARYPELYAVENRQEGVHLNLAGAAIFSRELAERFAEHTKAPAR